MLNIIECDKEAVSDFRRNGRYCEKCEYKKYNKNCFYCEKFRAEVSVHKTPYGKFRPIKLDICI